jgi:hypothetical protein
MAPGKRRDHSHYQPRDQLGTKAHLGAQLDPATKKKPAFRGADSKPTTTPGRSQTSPPDPAKEW